MTKMVESSQPNTNTTTNHSTNSTTQNQSQNQIPNTNQNTTTSNLPNANPFNINAGAGVGTGGNFLQGMLGNLMNNPNSIMQMTSMILGHNDLDLNNLLQGSRGAQEGNTNQTQTPNVNLNNLLNNILSPSASTSVGATINQPNNTSTSSSTIHSENRNVDNQYPMLNPPRESLANLENINRTWIGDVSESVPQVPKLNYPKNILTSLGETLKNYYNNVNRFLPLVLKLSELLERESLVQSSEERSKVQALISAIISGLDNISKANGSIQPLLNGLEYGQNPGQGHIRLVTTVGTQVVLENTSNISNQSANLNTHTAGTSETAGIYPTDATTSNTSGTARQNPMQDMLSQLSQPDNMRAMMSMVGNLLGNNQGSSASTSSQGTALNTSTNRQNAPNPLNNLLSQLLGNMGGDMVVDNEVPQNVQEYFNNILSDHNARKTTLLKDIPEYILKIRPNQDFAKFTQEILSQFSIQEIISLKTVNLRGFTRLRRVLREKLSNYIIQKFNNDLIACVKHLTENVSQIFIITENETDKMINNNFTVDEHIEGFFTGAFKIILNENLNDAEFELHLFNIFIKFFDDLFKNLTNSYNSGKEGALNYLDYNLEYLLDAIVGKDAVQVMISLNENILGVIIDDIILTYESKRDNVVGDDSIGNMQVDSESNQVC